MQEPDDAGWPAFCACTRDEVNARHQMSSSAKKSRSVGNFLVPLTWLFGGQLLLVLFVIAVLMVANLFYALSHGRWELPLLLALCHLPYLALYLRGKVKQEGTTSGRLTTLVKVYRHRTKEVSPDKELPGIPATVQQGGIHFAQYRTEWNRFARYEYTGENGPFFTVRIHYKTIPARGFVPKRALALLPYMVPSVLVLLTTYYGWTHFEKETDMDAAFFLSILHLFCFVCLVIASWDCVRPRHSLTPLPFDLSIDSRVVPANDFLAFVERQIASAG